MFKGRKYSIFSGFHTNFGLFFSIQQNSITFAALIVRKLTKKESETPSWRNGRRAGLKHLWETVPVRVRHWVQINEKGLKLCFDPFLLNQIPWYLSFLALNHESLNKKINTTYNFFSLFL